MMSPPPPTALIQCNNVHLRSFGTIHYKNKSNSLNILIYKSQKQQCVHPCTYITISIVHSNASQYQMLDIFKASS